MTALLLVAALAGSPEGANDCQIADAHYYVTADVERFPAIGSTEINWATAERITKEGGIYFEILIDRCSKRPSSLVKFQAEKPVYGYYYRYRYGRLIGLDLRYVDGYPTAQEV